jgi:salicylate hydroxylase
MAMEDSAALGECLARAKDIKNIPQAVRAFEIIRKPRTKILSDYGVMNAHMWQLPDGEEQRQRDQMIKNRPLFSAGGWDGKHIDKVPDTPKDSLFFAWMLAHDVVDFVRDFLLKVARGLGGLIFEQTNRRLNEIWV